MELSPTVAGRAVEERLGDAFAAIVRHYQSKTVDDKASEINIKIKLVPDSDRKRFSIEVSHVVELAPNKSTPTALYASADENRASVQPSLFEEN